MADLRPTTATVLTGEAVEPIDWEVAARHLDSSQFYWLASIHHSGRPHVRPVLAVWHAGAMYSTSSPDARKAHNLSADPRCSLTVTTEGLDVVVEGEAAWIDDDATLGAIRDAYDGKYGWPVTIVDGRFDAPYGAPTAGPPPYAAFRIDPTAVFGFGTNEELAPRTTRWTF